jgi:uncharacterized protein
MLGTIDSTEIEELLEREHVGRIGCISAGRPYVVPVCYVYRDGDVYGHTMEGMKWRAMQAHPDVCFEVECVDDLTNWRSVIAWGRFEELTGAAAEEGMRLLVDRLSPLVRPEDASSQPDHGGGLHAFVYRIRLDEKTGRYESTRASTTDQAGQAHR